MRIPCLSDQALGFAREDPLFVDKPLGDGGWQLLGLGGIRQMGTQHLFVTALE
jgi:hypothetical protein